MAPFRTLQMQREVRYPHLSWLYLKTQLLSFYISHRTISWTIRYT